MQNDPSDTDQPQTRTVADVPIEEFEQLLRSIVREEVWEIVGSLEVQERL